MADYTKQIFEMLRVKPGHIFKLKEIPNYSYKLTNNLKLYVRSDADKKWFTDLENRTLFMILKGVFNIVKKINLTPEEQLAIDYARACGCKWLAKDKNKTVTAFKEKPKKGTKEWLNTTNDLDDWIELYLPISFLQWEDKEPFYIGQDETEEKEVCKYYSGGECMGQKYHPSVECKGDKSCCERDN